MILSEAISELRDLASTVASSISAAALTELHLALIDPESDMVNTIDELGLDRQAALGFLRRYARSVKAVISRSEDPDSFFVRTFEEVAELPSLEVIDLAVIRELARTNPSPARVRASTVIFNHAVPYGVSWETTTLLVRALQHDKLEMLVALARGHKAPGVFAAGILAAHDTLTAALQDASSALEELQVAEATTAALQGPLARASLLNDPRCHTLRKAVRLTDGASRELDRALTSFRRNPPTVPSEYWAFNDGQLLRILEQIGLDSEASDLPWRRSQRTALRAAGIPTFTADLAVAVATRARRGGHLELAEEAIRRCAAGDVDYAEDVSTALAA